MGLPALNFFLLLILFGAFASLSAQFSGYNSQPSSSFNAGLSSLGTGIRDDLGSLQGNPAFLSGMKKHRLEANFQTGQATESSSHSLYSGGGYYQYSEKLGFGTRLSSSYNRYFPADEKFFHYSIPLFVSYRITESWGFAFAIGPAFAYRIPSYSSNSLYVAGYFSYESSRFNLGLAVESPGSFRYEAYRGSDRLKERLPERISLGLTYKWTEPLFVYMEVNRVFWERISFSLNEREEGGGLDLGFGRALYGSLGLGYRWPLGIRSTLGLTNEGIPLESGRFVRPLAGSLGLSGELLPSVIGPGLFLAGFLQRTAVFGDSSPLGAEFRFGFQLHSAYESAWSGKSKD